MNSFHLLPNKTKKMNYNSTMVSTNGFFHLHKLSTSTRFNSSLSNLNKLHSDRSNFVTTNNNFLNSTRISQGPNAKKLNINLNFQEILNLDIDNIIANNDIAQLEKFLEQLTYGQYITDNDDMILLINNFQLILAFLFDIQSNLEKENSELENNYKILLNESERSDNELKANKSLIKHYKYETNEHKLKLNLYRTIINEHKGRNILDGKVYFYCNLCSGRKFSSMERLDSHYNRKHYNYAFNLNKTGHNTNLNSPKENENIESLMETKMTKLKQELTSSLDNFHKENLNHLIENENNLEKKIQEIKQDKSNEIKRMENEFKKFLDEIKSLDRDANKSSLRINNESNTNFQTLSNLLENESKKINQLINQMNKSQNDKIHSIIEQLNLFKNNIAEEFKELRSIKPRKILNTNVVFKHERNTQLQIVPKRPSKELVIKEIVKAEIKEPIEITKEAIEIIEKKEDPIQEPVKILDTIHEQPSYTEVIQEPLVPKNDTTIEEKNLKNKCRAVFQDFLKREEDLFSDKLENDITKLKYRPIKDIEIVLKEENTIKEYLNNLLRRFKDKQLELSTFDDLETSPTSLITYIIHLSGKKIYSSLKNEDYYADYMDNITKLLHFDQLLSDENTISAKNLQEIRLGISEKNETNPKATIESDKIKNTNNSNFTRSKSFN